MTPTMPSFAIATKSGRIKSKCDIFTTLFAANAQAGSRRKTSRMRTAEDFTGGKITRQLAGLGKLIQKKFRVAWPGLAAAFCRGKSRPRFFYVHAPYHFSSKTHL